MQEFEEKLYIDPYCKEFDSVVVNVEKVNNGYWILCENTIFYPEGGGQSADHGAMNHVKIQDVQRREDGIWHLCAKPFEIGEHVHQKIDWEYRFQHMQSHSGEHIVSGLIHQHFGYDNVGFHMGDDVIQIDFNGVLTNADLIMIEKEVNDIIYQNIPISITYPTNEELEQISYRSKKELNGNIRIVTITDCDVCACCGTHVSNTGEIGLVKLLSVVHHKEGVRIEMLAGKSALEYFSTIHTQSTLISNALSLPVGEIGTGVEKLLDKQKEQYIAYQDLQKKYFQFRIDAMKKQEKLIMAIEENIDRNAMIYFCNAILEKTQCGIAMVLQKNKTNDSFIMMSKTYDLTKVKQQMSEHLQVRAGGKSDILQGSIGDDISRIQACMEKIQNHMS